MEAVRRPKKKHKKVRKLSTLQSNAIPDCISSVNSTSSSGDHCSSKVGVEEDVFLEEDSNSTKIQNIIETGQSVADQVNLLEPSTSSVENWEIEDDSSQLTNFDTSEEETLASNFISRCLHKKVANTYQDLKSLPIIACLFALFREKIYPDLKKCNVLEKNQLPVSSADASQLSSRETVDSIFIHSLSVEDLRTLNVGDELMSEDQLLHFYHNILYETTDDFIDCFIKNEFSGNYELSEYLKRYKLACQELLEAGVAIEKCETLISECLPCVWKECKCSSHQTGICGDKNHACGELEYTTAELQPGKLSELSELLKRDEKLRLDGSVCADVQAQSLALQIQWYIVELKNSFMHEFKIGPDTSPKLLYETDNKSARISIRRALSDLFCWLRYSQLPVTFTKSVTDWILELCAVLLKAGTCIDQQFLLCHILRLPSKTSVWSVALIQTYTRFCGAPEQLVIDNFLAMLSILFSPIRKREDFLKCILSSEEEDRSWNIVSEDLVEDDISLTAVDEIDLIAFLNQFSIESLFVKAINYFNSVHKLNPLSEVLSLMAFQLVLMKVFDTGLTTYAEEKFRQLCKQIGHLLMKSVKFLSEFWIAKRDLLHKRDRSVAQREFDRIVLQALYYVVGKKSLGLYQFLVELPYETVSDYCRHKCQLLLQKKNVASPSQLYQISNDVLSKNLESESLLDCLCSLSKDDSNYLIVALASVISLSEPLIHWFLTEVFKVCFIDECTRDDFYKVGAEAIGMLLDKRPTLISRVLSLIDRNIDTLDQYALEILSTASLSKCQITANDVGSICGKWLINRTPEHPASRIARRVLSSLNWGMDDNKKLHLDETVHCECAETIMKGHMAQCKHTNGLIAKSLHKITKLVLKVPDYEFQFEVFCWDVLLRLKLPLNTNPSLPLTDLTAYYVHIVQHCLVSAGEFFSKGQPLWSELVAAGCYRAGSVVIGELLNKFPESVENAVRDGSFVETFDRLLHSDQSAYALQLIAGVDNFPGPTVRLLETIIAHSLTENYSVELLKAWTRLLCSVKSISWTNDNAVLYLLGSICSFCFLKSFAVFSDVIQTLHHFHTQNLQQWKANNGKGLLAWLTSDGCLPTAVDPNAMSVSPWATYALLLAEECSFSTFYKAFYASLDKYPKYSVEQCQKKASAKSHFPLSVENLHFVRWLQFACIESVQSHPCFPLICQNIVQKVFCRRNLSRSKVCFANRYFATECAKPLFEKLLKTVLPRLELDAVRDKNSNAVKFYKAFRQWLTKIELRDSHFAAFESLRLGNIIQKLVCNEMVDWKFFVNCKQIESRQLEILKVYASVRHWGTVYGVSQSCTNTKCTSTDLVDLLTPLSMMEQPVPFPCFVNHNALPEKLPLTIESIYNVDYCLNLFGQHLQALNSITRKYVETKDSVDVYDSTYIEQFSNLYTTVTIQIPLVLSCQTFGNRCSRPLTTTVSQCVMQRQATVQNALDVNRQERQKTLTNFILQLLDSSAITCAHLEFMANTLAMYANGPKLFGDRLKTTGRTLFYHLISNLTALDMLFIASANTVAFILNRLGEVFIANQASEQLHLMNVSLNCSHLNHLIAVYFTPECLPSQQLVDAYKALSQAIKVPTTSSLALKLLSRLDIKNAGERLPPQQFSELMPLAFENLISLNDNDSSVFYGLCFDHFMHSLFYRFPTNFISGMSLILSACDSNSTPPLIFEKLIINLGVDNVDDPTSKPLYVADAKIALLACDVIANQLAKSRAELSTRLFTTWSKYLDKVCILCEFFIFKTAAASFDSNLSTNRIEEELQNNFKRTTRLFGPLIEPFIAGIAPWNADDVEVATCVVDRFVSVLKRLHRLYDSSLPSGSENLEALLCNYYGNHLCLAVDDLKYMYELLESRLISIPWNIFLPNLTHLSVMERLLKDSMSNCGSFLTQILVRLPWQTIIKQQAYLQPADATRAFFGLLLSIFARCVSRPNNYTKCPASLSKLLTSLSYCDWSSLKIDDLENTSLFIATAFPPSYLCDQNGVVTSFFTMYRKVSFYSTVPSEKIPVVEEYKKQAAYLRMQLHLMNRSGNDVEWMKNYYVDQIIAVNAIITARSDFSKLPEPLAIEITACWSYITDVKLGETLVNGLCDWLLRNSESQLVLLIMNTVIGSLCKNQMITGLKVLEKCIIAFFQRSVGCSWKLVVDWATIPEFCEQYLFSIPSSDKPVKLLMLTANVYLLQCLKNCSSPEQETAILEKFLYYMVNLRPKYVDDDAAFVVLIDKLQNLILRQYNYSLCSGNKFLTSYLEFLEKIYTDEKNASFFSKLQLITQVLQLYVTQQTVSSDRPLRAEENVPILNSRIQAYKDLCSAKHYASYKKMLSQTEPFFLQFRKYHIGHVNELLMTMVDSLFQEKYVTSLYER